MLLEIHLHHVLFFIEGIASEIPYNVLMCYIVCMP